MNTEKIPKKDTVLLQKKTVKGEEKGSVLQKETKRRRVYITEKGVEKVFLQVLIRRDIYDKLREYALTSNRIRGVLSEIVENALLEYMNRNPKPRTSKRNASEQIREILKVVAKGLGEESAILLPGLKVNEKLLAQAIKEARGIIDPRTVENWIKRMIETGVLKCEGGFKPDRVFKVVRIP